MRLCRCPLRHGVLLLVRANVYNVDYEQVPVTDEKAPEPKDLEALTQRIGGADASTPQIFNCHAGRGRTTTAMVVAQLIQDAGKPAKEGLAIEPKGDHTHAATRNQQSFQLALR